LKHFKHTTSGASGCTAAANNLLLLATNATALVHPDSLLWHLTNMAAVSDRCREGCHHKYIWPSFYNPPSISCCL